MARTALALTALVAFTAYTLSVALNHSLLGFLADHQRGGWSLQIFADLCVAATCFWIVAVPDARARRIPYWPCLLLTPLLGSIAVLAYLAHRSLRGPGSSAAAAGPLPAG